MSRQLSPALLSRCGARLSLFWILLPNQLMFPLLSRSSVYMVFLKAQFTLKQLKAGSQFRPDSPNPLKSTETTPDLDRAPVLLKWEWGAFIIHRCLSHLTSQRALSITDRLFIGGVPSPGLGGQGEEHRLLVYVKLHSGNNTLSTLVELIAQFNLTHNWFEKWEFREKKNLARISYSNIWLLRSAERVLIKYLISWVFGLKQRSWN